MQSGKWAVFLAFDGDAPVGMCEISLRMDYVEGTDKAPVGYIEGIFVLPEYRNQQIAKSLVALGEDWSHEQGCAEFASDCMLDNEESLRFHCKIGFEEAGRNIHFVKKLGEVNTTLPTHSEAFWSAIDTLISQTEIVIDRPKSTKHPRFDFIYPLDYGYLKDTTSPDGGGIDVWRGSLSAGLCDAVICTVDLLKKDSEIKLLIDCSEEEKSVIMRFHNDSEYMKGVMIRRGANG
jgi:inorganic pyrophosphatase